MNQDVIEKEEKLERVKLDHEIANEEASVAERQAVVSQLKRQYGHDYKNILVEAARYLGRSVRTRQDVNYIRRMYLG